MMMLIMILYKWNGNLADEQKTHDRLLSYWKFTLRVTAIIWLTAHSANQICPC
jgi:hypothetical protein